LFNTCCDCYLLCIIIIIVVLFYYVKFMISIRYIL